MVQRIQRFDRQFTRWFARHSVTILRFSLGLVFIWFGALKFVPGLSPAEALIRMSVNWAVDPDWFLPVLAVWEVAIGVGLIVGRGLRITLFLLAAHMVGTFLPVVVCPHEIWTTFPHGLTLAGQYVVKNIVLIGAALVLVGDLARPTLPGDES